jgi:hypothetical protein
VATRADGEALGLDDSFVDKLRIRRLKSMSLHRSDKFDVL